MAGRVGRSNGIGEMKETNVAMSGTVTDVDRGSVRVQLDNGHLVRATFVGRLRKHRIHVLTGDRISVEMNPYDLTKGRVIWRDK
jgi:translation initiation factor IF-1